MRIELISRVHASETEGQISTNFGPILEGDVTHAIPTPSSNASNGTVSQNNPITPSPTPHITAMPKETSHSNDGLLSFDLHHIVPSHASGAPAEGELAFVLARPTTTPTHRQETAAIMEQTPIKLREILYNPTVDISLLAGVFICLVAILFYKKR